MEFDILPEDSNELSGFMNPDIMSIGDSIFSGVRSACIDETMANWSPPAQLARAFGWNMATPDYRRPVLFQLEEFLRQGVDIGRLRRDVIKNAERWVEERGEWSSRRFFDNIAIAGATYTDLHELEASEARKDILGLLEKIKRSQDLDFGTVASLWFSIHAAFVLNPTADESLDCLTPLEQVASRKPKRLLINIGSNEGLFRIGITANFSRRNREYLEKVPELAKNLAKVLAEKCPDVERIYFNLLIRPRALANLAPRRDEDMFANPADGYFDHYVGRLASMNGMNGRQMAQFDESIKRINEATVAAMHRELGPRITFVDTYAMSTRFDAKHYGGSRRVAVKTARGGENFLSNYPFSANAWGFRHGGLFGLDNMHPTSVGHALFAQEMARTVAETEGLPVPTIDPQLAFDADTLIQDPPRNIGRLNFLASLVSDLGIARFEGL